MNANVLSENARRARTPWHLWALAIVSLVWFAGGANDYLMTRLGNMDYLAMAAESSGVPLEVLVDYTSSFPLWASIAWAIGVWGAVAGSLLLLFRSRFAFHAFIASIVGLAGSTVWTYTSDAPAALTGGFQIVFSIAIWLSVIGMAWYARAMTRRSVLR